MPSRKDWFHTMCSCQAFTQPFTQLRILLHTDVLKLLE